MVNYANLLATIAANIYTNGNNEVTAAMAKTAMDAMVASLGAGYQFMGVAHPADTPSSYADLRAFWLAGEAGTYTNFGGLVLDDRDVAVIKYDGNGWSKEVTGFADGINLVLGLEETNIETSIELDGKYLIYPGSSVTTYAPEAITEPFTLNKNESIRVKISQTDSSYAIAKKNGANSYTGLVRGIDSTWNNPGIYTYTASSDNEQICICYKKSAGITVDKFSSSTVARIEGEINDVNQIALENLEVRSGLIASKSDHDKIKQIVKSIQLFSTDKNYDLDGLNIRLAYIGFHDSNVPEYADKLVVQIRLINQDNTFTTLFNSFDVSQWEKGKIIISDTDVSDTPIRVVITLSDYTITEYAVTSVNAAVIPYNGYLLPQKQLVQSTSNNLINPNNIVNGWMVNGGSGTFDEVGSPWALVKWVVVTGLSQITFGINGVAGNSSIYSYAFYDNHKVYISGTTVYPNGATIVNVPSGAAFMCYTDQGGVVSGKHQVNGGSEIKTYDTFIKPYYISKEDEGGVSWFFKSDSHNTIHIGKGGGYDYNELQAVMDGITDDAPDNRYVIIVHPGVYNKVSQTDASPRRIRYMSIIGVDRLSCIVMSDTGNYYQPPFECYMDGSVENMSFIMRATEESYSPQDENDNYSYALHIDAQGDRTTLFRNCYFESNTGPAVGLGVYENNGIIFENCEAVRVPFRGRNDLGAWYFHGCVYANRPNQLLVLKNCTAENKDSASDSRGFVLDRVSDGLASECTLVIQNCCSVGVNGASGRLYQLNLSSRCFGNNFDMFNWSE